MQQVLRAAAWAVGEYSRPHLETLAKNHRRGERVWYDVIEVCFCLIPFYTLISMVSSNMLFWNLKVLYNIFFSFFPPFFRTPFFMCVGGVTGVLYNRM